MIHDTGTTVAETARRVWTDEALVAEGLEPKHHEIVDGVPVEIPGVSLDGGTVWSRLDTRIRAHVEAQKLGAFGICYRFLLREDPRQVRRPDLALIVAERAPERPSPPLYPGAPDLAIEILSPSDPASRAARKAREYLSYGTREVWNVDPDAETITVYRPDVPARAYSQGDVLESFEVLPGFALDLTELFAG